MHKVRSVNRHIVALLDETDLPVVVTTRPRVLLISHGLVNALQIFLAEALLLRAEHNRLVFGCVVVP